MRTYYRVKPRYAGVEISYSYYGEDRTHVLVANELLTTSWYYRHKVPPQCVVRERYYPDEICYINGTRYGKHDSRKEEQI